MKTREHATMSLNITKVTPEEIMGKLENGQLSVFIEKKPKKEPRANKMMGTADGIDVSKLKLVAYTNPKIERTNKKMSRKATPELTPESIREMMKYTAENSNKKISVVENNEEYVKLVIDGVREDEKVYLSVMNGDKVLKSYRIGEFSPRYNPNCWKVTGDVTQTTLTKDSAEVMKRGKGYWVDYSTKLTISNRSAGIYWLEISKAPKSGDKAVFNDDFFSGKTREINISGVNGDYGFRLIAPDLEVGKNMYIEGGIHWNGEAINKYYTSHLGNGDKNYNLRFGKAVSYTHLTLPTIA